MRIKREEMDWIRNETFKWLIYRASWTKRKLKVGDTLMLKCRGETLDVIIQEVYFISKIEDIKSIPKIKDDWRKTKKRKPIENYQSSRYNNKINSELGILVLKVKERAQ